MNPDPITLALARSGNLAAVRNRIGRLANRVLDARSQHIEAVTKLRKWHDWAMGRPNTSPVIEWAKRLIVVDGQIYTPEEAALAMSGPEMMPIEEAK